MCKQEQGKKAYFLRYDYKMRAPSKMRCIVFMERGDIDAYFAAFKEQGIVTDYVFVDQMGSISVRFILKDHPSEPVRAEIHCAEVFHAQESPKKQR